MSIDLPNYRVLEQIGTGAGSMLYKAAAAGTGELYTIKYVKRISDDSDKLIQQMRDEHACGGSLEHPVLRKTHEMRFTRKGLAKTGALLFMEYVDGVTLHEWSKDRSLIELLDLFEKVAEGLDAMHKGGFVHADLKPGNILITHDGLVKLIDFGQSSPINKAKERVQGTIDYMAPEQGARKKLDARTDVFGLGATLHRLLTGRPVATEMNQRVDLHSLGRVGVRIDENQQPTMEELPAVIAKLINDCCADEPGRRPQNMQAFIERLEMARLILIRRQAGTTPDGPESATESATGS